MTDDEINQIMSIPYGVMLLRPAIDRWHDLRIGWAEPDYDFRMEGKISAMRLVNGQFAGILSRHPIISITEREKYGK
jgi:hypothetical protein